MAATQAPLLTPPRLHPPPPIPTASPRATRPDDLAEVRDAGVYLFYLKRYAECVDTLREFLERAPRDSEDAEKIRRLLRTLE